MNNWYPVHYNLTCIYLQPLLSALEQLWFWNKIFSQMDLRYEKHSSHECWYCVCDVIFHG